jgi:hypothetical protein
MRWNGKEWWLESSMAGDQTALVGVAFAGPEHGIAVSATGRVFEWNGSRWNAPAWTGSAFRTDLPLFFITLQDVRYHSLTGAYYASAQWKSSPAPDLLVVVDSGEGKLHDFFYVMAREGNKLDAALFNFCGSPIDDFGIRSGSHVRTFIQPSSLGPSVYMMHSGERKVTRLDRTKAAEGRNPAFPALSPRHSNANHCVDAPDAVFRIGVDGLRDIWMVDPETGWAVGEKGIVCEFTAGGPGYRDGFTFNPDVETVTQSFGTSNLNDIWMQGKEAGFIVGDGGTILRFTPAKGIGLTGKVTLILSARRFQPGERIRYTMRKVSGADADLRKLERTVYRLQRTEGKKAAEQIPVWTLIDEKWKEIEDSLNKGKDVIFEWDQKDNRGNRVEPGEYAIEFRTYRSASSAIFTIEGEPDSEMPESPPSAGDLSFRTMEEEFAPDRKVRFALVNEGNRAVDLSQARFVIDRWVVRGGGEPQWAEFYTSPPGGLGVSSLQSGRQADWDWDRMDNERTTKARGGRWRATLIIDGVSEPFVCEFRLLR